MSNALVNPNTINVSPWYSGGAATGASTFQTPASGSSGLSQVVSVTGGQTYTAKVTIQGSAAAGTLFFAVYPTNYSTTYGSQSVSLTTSAQNLQFSSAIPAGVTSVVFELDFSSNSSAVVTITNAALNSPGGTIYSLTVTDSLTLQEKLAKTFTHTLTEALSLVESLTKTIRHSAVDAFTLIDSVQKTLARSAVDTLTLRDSAQKTIGRSVSETLALESFAPAQAIVTRVGDVLSLVDTLTAFRRQFVVLAETLALEDRITKGGAQTLSDVLGLLDTLIALRGQVLVLFDALALQDRITKAISRTLTETLSLFDGLRSALGLTRLEAIRLSEIAVPPALGTHLTEGLSLTESSARLETTTSLRDGLSLTDILNSGFGSLLSEALRVFHVRAGRHFWPVIAAMRRWAVRATLRRWAVPRYQGDMITTTKDSAANEDFQLDWTAELGTDTIVSSVWQVPVGLVAGPQTHTSTSATIRLGGGTSDSSYTVTNIVTLGSGQTKARSLRITIDRA